MKVSTEKNKIMNNSTNNISTDICISGQKLEEVSSFKYLGVTLCKNGTYSSEVRIRFASAMAEMARLGRIWRCNTISFASKFKLYKSLVTPSYSMAVKHGPCLLDSVQRTKAFGTKCPMKLLNIFYLEHKTNVWMQSKINFLVGPQEPLLATVNRWKLAWFGHVTRHDCLSKSSFRAPWRTTPWSAEKMLDGQHQRVDIHAHARTEHKGLLQKKTVRGSLLNLPSCPLDDPVGHRTGLN